MKTGIKIFILSIIINLGIWTTPQKSSAQISVNFQIFYDELSPYGTWVDNPDYGYVWYPDVAAGFSPYGTNGYWIFTEDGWTWVSDYPWGWAPFHYGRWYTDPYYGPMWVPDNEWGPGWVTWRRSAGYYGWAPIGPGVSINIAYSSGYNVPYNQWRFVEGRNFGRRDINNYYVDNSTNVTIINNTTVINNTRVNRTRNVTYNAGPERNEVEKHIGKTIAPIAIKENSKPGQNVDKDQLNIYRPQVQKNNSTEKKPAPTKVANLKDVKPNGQRKTETPPQKINQPTKEQPSQPRQDNPAKKIEREKQPQQNNPPKNKEREKQPQHKIEPPKEQPSQPRQDNPNKKIERENPPPQPKPNENIGGEKQPKHNEQPPKENPSNPKQDNPDKKMERENQHQQAKPHENKEGEKHPK